MNEKFKDISIYSKFKSKYKFIHEKEFLQILYEIGTIQIIYWLLMYHHWKKI